MRNFLSKHADWAALALLLSWDMALVAFRIKATGRITFFFFIWNLFLALLPYLSAKTAMACARKSSRFGAWLFLLVAVVFLPNAAYIVTDLFHLRTRADMPLWFDTMIIFSFALSGLLLHYAALWELRTIFLSFFGALLTEAGMAVLSFLSGFGIYLGRYLRFNSWDVLSNPDDLVDEITSRWLHPSQHLQTVGVTLLYGAFLWIGYWIIRLKALHVKRK